MSKNKLVIFCNSIEECISANEATSKWENIDSFYVLFCDEVEVSKMKFINKDDAFLCLDKMSQLDKKIEIGIRAGILYAFGWWNLLFCFSDDFPNKSDVDDILKVLNTDNGMFRQNKCWGFTREHVLFYGVGSLLGDQEFVKEKVKDSIEQEDLLLSALNGGTVGLDIITLILKDMLPLYHNSIQGNIDDFDEISKGLLINLREGGDLNYQGQPVCVFVNESISDAGIHQLAKNMPDYGTIVLLSKSNYKHSAQPNKVFYSKENIIISVFNVKDIHGKT